MRRDIHFLTEIISPKSAFVKSAAKWPRKSPLA